MTRQTPTWLQQGSYAASVDRRLPGMIWPTAACYGGVVTVSSGMTVNIAVGSIAVPTANNTGTAVCCWDAVEQCTLAAAPASGSNRYDLVVCQLRGNDIDGGANNDFLFVNVTGTAAATPTVPAVPNNAVAVAQIYVPGGSASVTAGNITDVRPFPPFQRLGVVTRGPGNDLGFTGTTDTFVMQVTVYVVGGRNIRLQVSFPGANSAVVNDRAYLKFKEGASVLGTCNLNFNANFQSNGGAYFATLAPSAGVHTYGLYVAGGTAGQNYNLQTANAVIFEVIDVGP